jgi:glycerophosphoryl diester phosphodiesterase
MTSLAAFIAPIFFLLAPVNGSHEAGAAPPASLSLRERLSGFSVGAHRGGSMRMDSNTISAFEHALEAGADILEMDLRLTKDGVPVVFHDPRLPRLHGHERAIADLTLEELREYKVALRHPIPTFEEVLRWCRGRAVINAEFKEQEVVVPAVRLVGEYRAHEWVYFQTKSDPLRYGLARCEDPRVALLFKPADEDDLDWALGLEDDRLVVIELDDPMRRPDVVERVHEAGKLASSNAWHFDVLQEAFCASAGDVFERGIDIAITKRPKSAARQRDRWEARADAAAQARAPAQSVGSAR